MTSLPHGSHHGTGPEHSLGLPARNRRQPARHAGLPEVEDLPASGCGEPELLELSSRACAAASSLLAPGTWASVMSAFDARPVTVAVSELGGADAVRRTRSRREALLAVARMTWTGRSRFAVSVRG